MNELYQRYIDDLDITVIFEDVYVNGFLKSTEVVGFYYGKPSEVLMNRFRGKRKAEFF